MAENNFHAPKTSQALLDFNLFRRPRAVTPGTEGAHDAARRGLVVTNAVLAGRFLEQDEGAFQGNRRPPVENIGGEEDMRMLIF